MLVRTFDKLMGLAAEDRCHLNGLKPRPK